MRNLEPRRRRWVRVRIGLLGFVLLVGAVLVGRRAYELQVERAPALKEMAEAQYLREIKLAPKRGTIYDRHGTELAVSVDVDSVWANPKEIARAEADPRSVATQLASVLSLDVDVITRRLASDRYFVWVERRITPRQTAAVRALDLPGVHMNPEARRYYPNRELASHLLGFANVDGEGIEGLELGFDDRLKGTARAVPAIRDRRGAIVFSEQLLDDRAAQGHDLVLTLDKTIQHVAERELSLAVQTFEAEAGSAVVMDPRTGELLAVANHPTFNPNEPGESAATHRRNRAVTDRFEPGSTVKPFTVAAALAAGRISSNQPIDCGGGSMEVAEYTIHDSKPYDELTPAQVLAYSSNVGAARIGATLGRRGLYRAMRRFGFGEAVDVGLPGETAGILRHYKKWYEMDAATISFGQGMSVTTLQLASAMSALANGGRLMEPYLVKRVRDGRGELLDETLPRVRRQVVPRSVSRLTADMMTAVTGPDGTGAEAALDGYLVAGKTGTAQKADYVTGGYARDKWLASFAGFVPAQDPRLAIAVVVDEPAIAHYGGTVAGPVFRRIAQASLRHLGVPASDGGDMLGRHAREQREANRADDDRDGATTEQDGADGSDPAEPRPAVTERVVGEGETVVPDVLGSTARAAVTDLHGANLAARIVGSGVVVSQDPAAGDVVPVGERIQVVLASPFEAPKDDSDALALSAEVKR
ncbi:MAG: penicillin-binding protein [Myxococcota bacterium]